MMGKFIDMTGWKMWEHGVPDSRWTVIDRVEDRITDSGRVYDMWLCECNCKKKTRKVVYGDNLRGGKSLSCGCISKESRHKNMLNRYEDMGDYIIGYTNFNNEPFYIDREDYDKIKNYVWYIGKDGYVVTHNPFYETNSEEPKLIRMHRLVLGIEDKNILTDHKNRKRNDNRKNNLRTATAQENSMNQTKWIKQTSSKYKGVCFHKGANKWVAYVSENGKRKHLGVYDTEEEAYNAYKTAAIKNYKEFANVEPRQEAS